MIELKNPEYLLLLLIFPVLIFYYIKYSLKRKSSIKFSSLQKIKNIKPSRMIKLRHTVFILRLLALLFFILAVARPRTGEKNSIIYSEGIDIMLCLDISDSMKGEDFQPHNRLEVAKQVIDEFIRKRTHDRTGLVIFGSQSFLQCPLTLDHGVLLDFLKRVSFHSEISKRTAIGMAIGNSINSLKETKTKSKIIILLTDGANNAGEIDPITASQLANTFDIKIYTIGIGNPGISQVMMTIDDPYFGPRKRMVPTEMNEEDLKQISEITKGVYFNARNKKNLQDIYSEIDKLEKTEITTKQYLEYNERFYWLVIAGVICLLLEILLANTRFRKLP